MLKNLIILPDGTEIFSGNSRDNAIISCKYTQCVNDSTELSIGSCCCNELEIKLFAKDVTIAANDEIQYYKVDESGARTKIGVFRCEKPTVTGTGTYKFVAYDNVSKLDKDLTDWLAALDGWPYTVSTFARMVCEACGLTLAAAPTVNAGYEIREFSGSGVTGRMLMQWLGQITCRFIRANSDGKIEFAWYADNGKEIATSGDIRFFGGSLSYEDFQVAEIQKVQIQVTDEDNGTVYPDGNEEELNTYKITGNYLLTAETGDELKPVAQAIFQQLKGVTYTPCKVSVPATTAINAGDIVHVTDRNGVRIAVYVMTKTNSGQKDTIECTGSYARDSSTATNEVTLKALSGKMLNISKSVDGLRIENRDTAGKVADLELNVDNIEARVADAEKGLSEIVLSPGQVKVTAQQTEVVGTVYSFSVADSGDLILTYTGEKPGYSINDSGELLLEYEGDTPPDTWIDEDGFLRTTEESAMEKELVGTLTSVIDGDGTWESKFEQNGEVVSSIRFDLASRRFVFDGDIVVGNDLKNDITKITNDTLTTTNVVAQNLQVNAAHILGTLTFAQLPENVASKDDIPDGVSDEYITTITERTIRTSEVTAEKLKLAGSININDRFIVDASGNVTLPDNASISWGQVNNKPSNLATTDYVAGLGYQTATQVTQITKDTLKTTNVIAENLQVNAANVSGTLTGNVLSGVTGDFSGTVTATYLKAVSGGNIAGWTIDDNSMRIGTLGASGSMWLCNTGTSTSASIGTGSGNGWCIAVGSQFGVKKDGVLYASNADLSGKITAASGNIGGFTIASDNIKSTKSGYGLGLYPAGIQLGSYTFFVVIYSNGGATPVGGLTASGWKTI